MLAEQGLASLRTERQTWPGLECMAGWELDLGARGPDAHNSSAILDGWLTFSNPQLLLSV